MASTSSAGRIELKYWIGWRQREAILRLWRPYLVPAPYTNEYGIYPIMSLYYDSPSLIFFDEKLEGEKLRNKIRLRGYGYRWRSLSPLFLEIKRKVNERIIKYRKKYDRFHPDLFVPESWDLDGGVVDGDGAPGSGGGAAGSGRGEGEAAGLAERDRRDLAQIAALVHRYRLRPAVQILYQREAYESPFFPSLRIAFDSQVVALHPGQEVRAGVFEEHGGHRITGDLEFVFEIKSSGGLPGWVMDGIRLGQVTQRAISKYCMGIEKLDLHHREIGVYA
ncbi:MAG: polyphosphate polymerase domain-containing protein [Holophagales bacterium]|nr:polyphosphate polymerase domain-containing protein [Holophagales bacterium]